MAENRISVIITGKTGVGKSAVYGEIMLALKAIGVEVHHADPHHDAVELSFATEWHDQLADMKPVVTMHEINRATVDGMDIAAVLGDL